MTESDKEGLAKDLSATSFTVDEIDLIMRDEVAPIFHWNLLSVAGYWSGWRREEVVQDISERLIKLQKQPLYAVPFVRKLNQTFCMFVIKDEWNEILGRVVKRREN